MRDLVGYGPTPPEFRWPNGGRVALQVVVNYEQSAERSVVDGDEPAETYLREAVSIVAALGRRSVTRESIYEFGSRVGIWPIMGLFEERPIPFTLFGVGLALERNQAVAENAAELGFDFASHGYRWIDNATLNYETEREHIVQTVEIISCLTGKPTAGWCNGRTSENTRAIIPDIGCFLYQFDSHSDEMPCWIEDHLVTSYAFDTNDQKFAVHNAFSTGQQFGEYLRASLDFLLSEAGSAPRIMPVGFHPRLVDRPSWAAAFTSFLDYAMACEGLWICSRHDTQGSGLRPIRHPSRSKKNLTEVATAIHPKPAATDVTLRSDPPFS